MKKILAMAALVFGILIAQFSQADAQDYYVGTYSYGKIFSRFYEVLRESYGRQPNSWVQTVFYQSLCWLGLCA